MIHSGSKIPVTITVRARAVCAEHLVADLGVDVGVPAVGQERGDLDQIVDVHAGVGEDGPDVVPDQPALRLGGGRDVAVPGRGICPLMNSIRPAVWTSSALW